jgi:hypothetical protein
MNNISKIYGRRVLHFLSPVKFKGSVYQHNSDSNYKVVEKTIKFLPMCHHYLVVPENHTIQDTRPNVTLLKYPYPKNAVSNRATFDFKSFRKILSMKDMDVDFVFVHQPELMYNVMMALSDERYGEIVNKFLFFHWVDCPQSRGSAAIPHSYMQQLGSINQCSKVFFHTKKSSEYFKKNYTKDSSTNLNLDFVKSKSSYFPLASDPFPNPKPFNIPNKKVVVFNHRWNKSTGWKRMVEYTEDLGSEYLIWCTDPRAPKEYVAKPLPFDEYGYLLKNSLCSICFVDSYATWNLSVQDGLRFDRPVLCYKHPIMTEILGDDYPFFFKTKEEFLGLLDKVEDYKDKDFKWDIPDYDEIFKNNLISSMEECIVGDLNSPKDATRWIHCILNGYQHKQEITNQVQPNMGLNSVWQYIRRWLLVNGVVDDPNCEITKYSIPDDCVDKLKSLTDGLDFQLKPNTTKQKTITNKNHGFF